LAKPFLSVETTRDKKSEGDDKMTVMASLLRAMMERHSAKIKTLPSVGIKTLNKALRFAKCFYHNTWKNMWHTAKQCPECIEMVTLPSAVAKTLSKGTFCRVLHTEKHAIFPVFIIRSQIWHPTQINI